ncbi:MAG: PFL family protein [Thermoguttaceae bacterium]|nr:PFL family protein [Thermoguttaceae bacterium]MDW8077335.1 PFL family protein [Thermoguttaceae bacterium]
MLRTDEILSTIEMLHAEHLDVRAVTLALNVEDCAAPSVDLLCRKLRNKILSRASRLVEVCDRVGAKYGIPVINKRLAISPVATILAGHGQTAALQVAKTLDSVATEIGVDFVGGFTALVHKGITPSDAVVIRSLPEVLSQTERVCASVNVASRHAGINMDAVHEMGHIILKIAQATADRHGFGCAKLVVFANIPEDNPFMAGAYMGPGEPEAAVNIGVSGPGVVCSALKRRIAMDKNLTLGDLAEEIKITSFRVTRVGELIGREVAAELGVAFGIVDLSLAPTPTVGDSVGEILKTLGIAKIGAPGSTAAIAMLTDAVKKGGLFASSSVGGLSGAFIPVCEDAALAEAAGAGHLVIEKLEAMTAVCSVGLDMILLPGDTPPETIAALIADEMAIGVINDKTTAARLIPVPGAKAGDWVHFGGLFGSAPVMDVRNAGASAQFVHFGGRIPAPLQSLKN